MKKQETLSKRLYCTLRKAGLRVLEEDGKG